MQCDPVCRPHFGSTRDNTKWQTSYNRILPLLSRPRGRLASRHLLVPNHKRRHPHTPPWTFQKKVVFLANSFVFFIDLPLGTPTHSETIRGEFMWTGWCCVLWRLLHADLKHKLDALSGLASSLLADTYLKDRGHERQHHSSDSHPPLSTSST